MLLSSSGVRSARAESRTTASQPKVRPDANYRRASVAGRVVPAIFILVLSACGTGARPSDESEDGLTPATVEIQRQQFDSDAVTIEALVAGNEGADEVIVLLAGRGCGAMCFIGFLPLLADAGFRAVALNPRGADGSRGSLDNLTLHDFAADVARVIEQMGVGPVHVLGHGFGNRVARCVASDRPELVAGLVLLGAGGQVKGDVEALEALERLYVPELSQDQTLAALQTALFAPGSDASVWADMPVFPELAGAQNAADRDTPREDWLAGGVAPMLVIQGRHDRITPPANGRWLRERFGERVLLVELANSGHALLPEQPDEIVDAIVEFVGEVRAGP